MNEWIASSGLSEDDERELIEIIKLIASLKYEHMKQEMRVKDLEKFLIEIKQFCSKGDGQDVARRLVCGVCFNESGLLYCCTARLKKLLDMSKSRLNGLMKAAGYESRPARSSTVLFDLLGEVNTKEWVVKEKANSRPAGTDRSLLDRSVRVAELVGSSSTAISSDSRGLGDSCGNFVSDLSLLRAGGNSSSLGAGGLGDEEFALSAFLYGEYGF